MQTQLQLKRIAVLMATFNGARYIKAQIDSILTQQGTTLDLFLRDDGSDDQTLDIIGEYLVENQNVFLIESDERLGAAGSFLELMNAVPTHYEYYAFADQDDIWMPNKLEKCRLKLEHLGADEIGIAYCGYRYIDENGSPLGTYKTAAETEISWKSAVVENPAAGFSILMNRACLIAARLSKEKYKRVRMHDFWVHQVAFLLGRTQRVPECLVDYRIHSSNTVGIKKDYLHLNTYRKVWRNYFMLRHQLSLFLETFGDEMPDTLRTYIEGFLVSCRRSLWFRLSMIRKGAFWFGRGPAGFCRKILFFTGK